MMMGVALKAQILTPVKWSYAAKETGKNEAVVFLKATIDDGWRIYSQIVKGGWSGKNQFHICAINSLCHYWKYHGANEKMAYARSVMK